MMQHCRGCKKTFVSWEGGPSVCFICVSENVAIPSIATKEPESNEQPLTKQMAECMEFFIWLNEYRGIDPVVHRRLIALLHELVRIGDPVNGRKVNKLDPEDFR